MTIKTRDFIEIEYTGRIKEDNRVFDTTDMAIAKTEGLFSANMKYGPLTVCVGEGHVVRGIEKKLIGKEVGNEYEFELAPDEAFGKKDSKLLKIVPMSALKKHNINPFPGLQVNMDGAIGTIRTVTGGRTIIDFNHPLSGKDVIYKVKVNKIVTDVVDQVKSILKVEMRLTDITVKLDNNKAEITTKYKLPEPLQEPFAMRIKELTKVDDVEFKGREKLPKPAES